MENNSMNYEVRLSKAQDKLNISKMIYEIYAKELGQYGLNEDQNIIDKYHDTNNYLVVYDKEELVGMVSITIPSMGQISTLNRLPNDHEIHHHIDDIAEVRLLSIKKEYRSKGIYKLIIFKVMQFCDLYNIHRILISAISNKKDMYELMGFKQISVAVTEGNCCYIPMQLLRKDFCESPYYKILDGLRLYEKSRNKITIISLSLKSILNAKVIQISINTAFKKLKKAIIK